MELKNIFVLKFPKIIQALFYFIQYEKREDVCERGTNKLQWKKAKQFINDDMFAKMTEHWPCGPKDHAFKEYERLAFISRCLSEYNILEVEEYSMALAKIMKWILQAIELRTEDVKQRRDVKEQLRIDREEKIAKEAERKERRQTAFDEAKAKHDEEVALEKAMREEQRDQAEEDEKEDNQSEPPEFDGDGWILQFDDEYPPIEIPDEVIADTDNDFNIVIENPEQVDD